MIGNTSYLGELEYSLLLRLPFLPYLFEAEIDPLAFVIVFVYFKHIEIK
jgi:hypothetical protein